MLVKEIKIENFKNFSEYQCSFDTMTFISGRNGAGKTTLGLEAILFGLYGYSSKNLADLPTRDKSKSCGVEITIELQGDIYVIYRKYPSYIKVLKNEEELKFSTLKETQGYLNSLFGDANYFKKFRMIDSSIGINFLEEGTQTLKKILFSASEDMFNKVKENLNTIKREREIYNKSKAVIYTHHPSEKRLNVLVNGARELLKKLSEAEREDRGLASDQLKFNNQKGRSEGQLSTSKRNLEQIKKNTHCYACKQPLLPETKEKMQQAKVDEIKNIEKSLKEAQEILEEISEIKQQGQPVLNKLKSHSDKINRLKMKLEGRLKQKEYVYTDKDVEIVKQALKELDGLSSRYLIQSIKVLEPIINSVLEKISFEVSFDLSDKGKFIIYLFKEGVKYNYKDLSTGQKLVLQVAFKLALLLEKNETGIVIADEGLGSLDQENLTHILRIFENYPFQIILMLHRFNEVPAGIKVINLGDNNVE